MKKFHNYSLLLLQFFKMKSINKQKWGFTPIFDLKVFV